jgi:pantoate--beta-alanine ligase
MEVIADIETLRRARTRFDHVGFVPTMGFLHEGHLSLVRRSRAECSATIASIFVNPAQFGPQEDFASYPRDMERDLQLLRDAGVDLVFTPTTETIYPAGFSTSVAVQGVSEMLEGASRPVFFQGVATVVCKLLNMVQPQRAYFGQKDAQQCVVVRKMVRDLNIPTEIVVCPTVREADGLAMSSRNAYLSPEERKAAPILYHALSAAKEQYEAGERNAQALQNIMQQVLDSQPLVQIDYVSVAHSHTLQELDEVGEEGALLSMAVRIGPARLIDNLLLTEAAQ